ncbi:MAG: hypothetical protein K5886_01900 [Lachnospiraceae bacterium]|nr:hypothetical protein [Lachnospiraceae bacterium]
MIYLISLVIAVMFFVMSLIAGYVIFIKTRHMDKSLVTLYCQGMAAVMVIFALCNTVASLFSASVRFSAALWLSVLLILELVFVFRDTRLFPVFLKELWADTKKRLKNGPLTYILGSLVFLSLVFQIIFITGNMSGDAALLSGVEKAVRAYETGIIDISSPMMMLCAALSILTKIHPLTFIFYAWPFVILPVYYGFEWSLSGKLFKDDIDLRLFMMVIFTVLQVFGFYSDNTAEYTLLLSYFRTGTFVLYAILPMVLWFVIHFLGKREGVIKDTDNIDEYTDPEEEDMKNHKIVNARTVGVLLLLFMIISVGFIFILNRKINSLHDVVAGMQDERGTSVNMKEFGTSDGQGVMVMEKSESIIVIGGTDETVNPELYEYLSGFDKDVEAWYIHEGEAYERSSLDYCKKAGLFVDKVYVIREAED